MKDVGEEEIGQLHLDDEEAKNELYNENNDNEKDKEDRLIQSNRYTIVDNNFDDKSRENSLGFNKFRSTSKTSFNEEMNQNGNLINDSNNASKRVSRQSNNKIIELKIILSGNVAVGKTSIIERYINGSFQEKYNSTIQAEYKTKIINEDENTSLRLNIWDTAGQEKFKSITRQFYRDSHGAIIVFDLTKKDTFDDVNNWIKEIKNNGNTDTVIMVLGNKSDLINEREVLEEDIKNMLNDKFVYFDVSAKEGNNISLAFDTLKKNILENLKNKIFNDNFNDPKVTKRKLDKDIKHENKNKSKRCC